MKKIHWGTPSLQKPLIITGLYILEVNFQKIHVEWRRDTYLTAL
jgi:hypothetical protein